MKELYLREYLIVVVVAISLILGGCATAPNALFITKKNEKNGFYATDSRLRLVVNSTPAITSIPGSIDPKRIVCTEPSPDVATALANSMGFGINILGQGNASLTSAQAEGLIKLGERTASIQLLRDKMYQSCLAYQNGAITGTTYSLIMTKLDDTIITLMLGEVAAGAFGRSLGGIGTEANAKASALLSGLPGDLQNIDESIAKLASLNQKIDTLEGTVKDSEKTLEKDPTDENKAALETQKKELANAKAERHAFLQIMKSSAQSASNSVAKVNKLKPGGSITQKPGPLIAAELSRMQDNFLSDASIEQVISTCLVDFGKRVSSKKEALKLFNTKHKLLSTKIRTKITEKQQKDIQKIISQRSKDISTPTILTDFCIANLDGIINQASKDNQRYRMKKIKTAQTSDAIKLKIAEAEMSRARQKALKTQKKMLEDCATRFAKDAALKKKCESAVLK